MLQIPLQSIDIRGNVWDMFAHVEVTSVYSNNLAVPLETEYMFTLDPNAVIDSLLVKIGNREIEGHVEEKSQAWTTYTEAVKDDKRASLLEKNQDIYSLKVGNMQPSETIVVKYTYLSKLTMYDGAYKFVYPTNIGPRYGVFASNHPHLGGRDYTPSAPAHSVFLSIDCHSTSGIEEIFSLTNADNLVVKRLSTNHVRATTFTLPSVGDFNLFMKTEQSTGLYTAALGDDEYVLLSHKIGNETAAGGVVPMQYIFLIDRSGSMEQGKMETAVEALIEGIQKLPSSAYFNVVSFGSWYRALYSDSVPASEENKEKTISIVKNSFTANMGGTEVYQALQAIYNNAYAQYEFVADKQDSELIANKASWSKVIVFMTDGQISDLQSVYDLVTRNPNARIFSIGIGHDASRALVEDTARLSNGWSHMAIDAKNIADIVNQMIHTTKYVFYSNVSVELGGAAVEYVGRDIIFPGSYFSAIVKVPRNNNVSLEDIKLVGHYNTVRTEWSVDTSNLTASEAIDPLLLEKLYAHELILHNDNPGKRQRLSDAQIVALSVQHNIMNQLTSFVMVDVVKAHDTEQQAAVAQRNLMTVEIPQFAGGSAVHGQQQQAADAFTFAASGSVRVSSGAGGRGDSSQGGIRVTSFTPTSLPSSFPSAEPTSAPSFIPTAAPTAVPTSAPSFAPTHQPTASPTAGPSVRLSSKQSSQPSCEPANFPSEAPTDDGMDNDGKSAFTSLDSAAVLTNAPATMPSHVPSHGPPTPLPYEYFVYPDVKPIGFRTRTVLKGFRDAAVPLSSVELSFLCNDFVGFAQLLQSRNLSEEVGYNLLLLLHLQKHYPEHHAELITRLIAYLDTVLPAGEDLTDAVGAFLTIS